MQMIGSTRTWEIAVVVHHVMNGWGSGGTSDRQTLFPRSLLLLHIRCPWFNPTRVHVFHTATSFHAYATSLHVA
jgi:hypothetical protein